MSPFIDSNGLLRVGGRLKNSQLPYDSKYPLLLPKKCHLASLICDYYHIITCHAGPNLTQVTIQQKYWIFALRNLVRHRIFICVKCHRVNAKPPQPLMADLPKKRVTLSRAFQHCVSDLGGPLMAKESHLRKSRTHKVWFCIFICQSTKACHIELVSELSTSAFLACFDRFVSRRSLPESITTDCGKNYVGSARELKEAIDWLTKNENEVFSALAMRNVSWFFNPPYGSNFSGLAEAGVKSCKKHLYKLIGSTVLTFEEYSTIFSKIEAALNSRPLCYLSTTPDEGVDYLSPGHFLIGSPLLSRPEETIPEDVTLRCRWQRLNQLSQAFWKRWSKEYLNTQIQRGKWLKNVGNIQVNQIVYITDLNSSFLNWSIGRVLTTYPGADGIVRVCRVKTAGGELVRPVNKLIPLPMV